MASVKLSVLLKVALLASLSTILMNIQFSLIPAYPYLKYDGSEIPALIAGFSIAPLAGAAVVILKNLIFLFTHFQPQELIGIPINTIAGLTFVLVACGLYHLKKSKKAAKVSLILGVVAMSLVMIPVCLLLLPIFQRWFMPELPVYNPDTLVKTILFVLLPFNLVKGGLTGLLTFVAYKRVSRILKTDRIWDEESNRASVGS